jgi:hypothetical protein
MVTSLSDHRVPLARRSSIEHGRVLVARAAISSYVVLAGVWFLLSLTGAVFCIGLHRSGMATGIVLPLAVGMMWAGWLRGFRLEIDDQSLRYRDGLYKSVAVPRTEIQDVKNAWIEWKLLTRAVRVPRLLIIYGSRRSRLAINAKPFRRKEIQQAIEILRTSGSRTPRG